MKIVIATPLYPPDIAEPAPYAKELTQRLGANHEVTVVLFGHLPETVDGTKYVTVDKRSWLPIRLWNYAKALWLTTKGADVLYVLDGSSVELVAGILSLVRRTPLVFHLGDEDSNTWINGKFVLQIIRRIIRSRAHAEIRDLPPQRPEILPFAPYPSEDFEKHEQSWVKHVTELESLFNSI